MISIGELVGSCIFSSFCIGAIVGIVIRRDAAADVKNLLYTHSVFLKLNTTLAEQVVAQDALITQLQSQPPEPSFDMKTRGLIKLAANDSTNSHEARNAAVQACKRLTRYI